MVGEHPKKMTTKLLCFYSAFLSILGIIKDIDAFSNCKEYLIRFGKLVSRTWQNSILLAKRVISFNQTKNLLCKIFSSKENLYPPTALKI